MATQKKKAEMIRYSKKIIALVVHTIDCKCEFQTDKESITIDFWCYPEDGCDHLSLSSTNSTPENERRLNAIIEYVNFGIPLPSETQFLL